MLVADLPESPGIGIGRHTLEHQADRAIAQRPINDVAVTGDPTDIGGTPVDLAILVIEYQLVGHRRLQQVTGGAVQHAFRLAGGARGIKNEQWIVGIHRLGFANVAGIGQRLVIPDITAILPCHLATATLDDDRCMHMRALLQRLVGIGLKWQRLAGTNRLVGSDQALTVRIENPAGQGIRRECTEHDGVHRTDAGTGQHRDRGFRNHRHVNRDSVTFFDTAIFQYIGEFADIGMHFAVGNFLVFTGIIAFPKDGDLVSAGIQMTVETVVGDVQLTTQEPLDTEVGFIETPFLDLVPFF